MFGCTSSRAKTLYIKKKGSACAEAPLARAKIMITQVRLSTSGEKMKIDKSLCPQRVNKK
jgi:hypothetical protein